MQQNKLTKNSGLATLSRKRDGFTLIELLVVISVIGMFSSIILAELRTAKQKAEATKSTSQISEYVKALLAIKADTGDYPLANGAWAYSTATFCLGSATCVFAGANYTSNSELDASLSKYLPQITNPIPYTLTHFSTEFQGVVYRCGFASSDICYIQAVVFATKGSTNCRVPGPTKISANTDGVNTYCWITLPVSRSEIPDSVYDSMDDNPPINWQTQVD